MNAASSKLAIFIVLAGLAVIALFAWRNMKGQSGEARIAPRAESSVQRFTLADSATYLQTDPRWANEKIGGSDELLKSVGCTLCCLSMALAHHGLDLPPPELNRKLTQMGGYTEHGWVIWNTLEKITSKRVRIDLPRNPSHQDLDDALRAGCPILVKVLLSSGIHHWVLLIGRDGNEYLMKDPLGDGKSLEPLSTLQSDILSVRIVRKL